MRNEGRGNYFDQWERGEYSIDPRDLVPVEKPDMSSVVIYDTEGFQRLMGEGSEIILYESHLLAA